MTDAHCHLPAGAARHFLCEPLSAGVEPRADDGVFYGVHPWLAEAPETPTVLASLRARLHANPRAGVGEIGLDRLKTREISPRMREVFAVQLQVAAELHRPVVLHGAKCWGEVVKAAREFKGRIPAFLFHGFSRSAGLLPEIVALNGFVSVGPAVLNDHAVNYRALVRALPAERLLIETDRTTATAADAPQVEEVLAAVAALRGVSAEALAAQTDVNAQAFIGGCGGARQAAELFA